MSSRAPVSPAKRIGFSLIALLLFAFVFELGSWVVLLAADAKLHARYNRVTSGYSVFRTTPDFSFITNRSEPEQPQVTTDSYGFVHDGELAESKPEGTVRIFLNGGSALFGAGQAAVYEPERAYPRGVYSYPISIAGMLESYLAAARPDLDFEVINAAAYTKRMHQSIPDYLATISRFDPDFVINMDGYNDLSAFVTGTPWADLHEEMQDYIDLEAPPRFPEFLGSYQLMKRVVERLFGNPFDTGLEVRVEGERPSVTVPRERYDDRRPAYVDNAQRFLESLDHYMAVLRQDDVEFLFALQPMVDRLENKPLTESEAAWQRYVQSFKDENPDYRLILRYFFDDYLSAELASRVHEAGFDYIDLGRASRVLGSDFQLFTDYCHLTEEGNQFVAEQMGAFVLAKLDERQSG